MISSYSLLSTLQRSRKGLQFHAQLITSGLIPNPQLAISEPSTFQNTTNTFVWNTLIRFYANSIIPKLAVALYIRMLREGVESDSYTYPFVLKACSGLSSGCFVGLVIHGQVLKGGFEDDLFVRNALINLYCSFGEAVLGRVLFDGFIHKDLVSWNTMIKGYVSRGEMGDAQKLFDEMPERDKFTWATMIDGYGKKLKNLELARKLFDEMPCRDHVCWNSMIDGYAGVGNMDAAIQLFESMLERNVISWSIMIDGYARHGKPEEALDLFHRMLCQGMRPDSVCAVGAISACVQLGALEEGRWLHSYLERKRIAMDVVVLNALIDMYMKCGSPDNARVIFKSLPEKNVVLWNVMITGLGNYGHGEEALALFNQMERERAKMDDLTLLGVLTVCAHSGFVDEGMRIFQRMNTDFGIEPKVEHIGCLVDLLGRAGRLAEARNVIETTSSTKADPTSWWSLLAACRKYSNTSLAEVSFQRLMELRAEDSGAYAIMSNIYAEEGMWEDAERMRKLMRHRGVRKEKGRSVVEMGGFVHEFVSGDRTHAVNNPLFKEGLQFRRLS